MHARGAQRRPRAPQVREVDEMHTGDEAIAMLARGQHGIVTSAQLAEPDSAARDRASGRDGRLVRLRRGVFQVGPVAAARGREMAAVLATGGILSHHTAADLWGIRPHHGAIDITVTGPAPRSRPGLAIHRSRSLNAAVHDGLPLTTPTRTLHDLAATCRSRARPRRRAAQMLHSPPLRDRGRSAVAPGAVDRRGRRLRVPLDPPGVRARPRPRRRAPGRRLPRRPLHLAPDHHTNRTPSSRSSRG